MAAARNFVKKRREKPRLGWGFEGNLNETEKSPGRTKGMGG